MGGRAVPALPARFMRAASGRAFAHVDDVAVAGFFGNHVLPALADVFGFDEFDGGLDVVGGAVVDDFLHFLDRADQRTAEIDAVERSGQDVNLVRLFKVADADKAQGAFAFQGAQDAVHFELVGGWRG